MDKTITQLSEDYFDAAKKMDFLIKKCTCELKEATACHDYDKSYSLKQKRLSFYRQKRELTETAYFLRDYYRKEPVTI